MRHTLQLHAMQAVKLLLHLDQEGQLRVRASKGSAGFRFSPVLMTKLVREAHLDESTAAYVAQL